MTKFTVDRIYLYQLLNDKRLLWPDDNNSLNDTDDNNIDEGDDYDYDDEDDRENEERVKTTKAMMRRGGL